jgi:hypothetical protein
MYNIELYNNIYKAEIQESIYLVTKLILENKNNEIIENTFIAIASYIGTFITLQDIRLWIDIIEEIESFIKNDKIVIKDIYILVTKLCIVCDIYIKNPKSKSGMLSITKLRDKIINIFEDNKNLDYYYITKFEEIMPPSDSETYNISKTIIASIMNIINNINNINNENELIDTSEQLRNIFDYISRKTYKFETIYKHTDNDSIWFLWGIISKICIENFGEIAYNLFMTNYSKKLKTERLGLIWGTSIGLIYLQNKNISRVWLKDEIILIKKINEVALDLYNQIKKDIYKTNNYKEENIETEKSYNNNALNYFLNYKPQLNDSSSYMLDYNSNNYQNNNNDDLKKIRYDKK